MKRESNIRKWLDYIESQVQQTRNRVDADDREGAFNLAEELRTSTKLLVDELDEYYDNDNDNDDALTPAPTTESTVEALLRAKHVRLVVEGNPTKGGMIVRGPLWDFVWTRTETEDSTPLNPTPATTESTFEALFRAEHDRLEAASDYELDDEAWDDPAGDHDV